MSSDSQVVSNIAAYIAAIAACISAFFSCYSWKRNQWDTFINQSKEKLDKIYIDLSEFIQSFTIIEETKEKRIARDRILFSLDGLSSDFSSSNSTYNQAGIIFYKLSMIISDITYENNFEKNMIDLSTVKSLLSELRYGINSCKIWGWLAIFK